MKTTAFVNRLRKNHRHWGKWARRRGISCYRIYDRDIPEFPLAIDWYEGRAHAQVFARKGYEELDLEQEKAIAQSICEVLEIKPEHLAFKTRQRQTGLSQYEKTGNRNQPFRVHEAGLAFEVDLQGYLDTGLFLDHRNTRALVRDRATGKLVLNLFSYTGSFSVYAAAGEAHAITSVDLSNTYQAWGRRNMHINGLDSTQHEFIRADVFAYLEQAIRERKQFGLIVLDPPSFSNSKKMQATLDVQRDHPRLISACLSLLKQGGELFFSTNRRKFKLDADLIGSRNGAEITHHTVPDDFRRHPTHRCWHFQNS